MDRATTARLAGGVVATGRLAAAGAAAALMALVVVGAYHGVEHYAIQFCGWPARVACTGGSDVWWLVPAGLGAGAVVGTVALVEWAVAGRDAWRAWAFPAWVAGFPIVVLMTGAKRFDLFTLFFVGGYAGLLIHLIWRFLGGSVPEGPLRVAVVVAWLAYVAVLSTVPDLLAAAAEGR